MKNYILIYIVIYLFSCSQSKKEEREQKDSDAKILIYDKIVEDKIGFLVIDLLNLKENNGTVSLFNHNREYIIIDNQNITVNGIKCNYFENTCKHLLFGDLTFNLEFDFFAIPCFRKTDDSLYVFINNTSLAVPANNSFVHFEPFTSYFKNKLISFDSTNCLKKEPNDIAECIDDGDQYQYTVINFKGNWVELQVDQSQYDTIFTGWVKWIKKDSILIKPIYIF